MNRYVGKPLIESLEDRRLLTASYYVATTGNDSTAGDVNHPFRTIAHAIDVANAPGDTVYLRQGTYNQRFSFKYSGSAAGGYITVRNYGSEHVTLTGVNADNNDSGFGQNMVQIINLSYIKVQGLEIAYNNGISIRDDANAIYVGGSGTNIELLNNQIHDITGRVLKTSGGLNQGYAGVGIAVYGTSLGKAYSNVTISGNTIYNCQPGDDSTETLTLNGNVSTFNVSNNVIHDCNNIGIDVIGGEADVFGKPDGTRGLPVARNGLVQGNTVYKIHANYGDGYADAIYIDGGVNTIVQRNNVSKSDLGIEVGAENAGYVATANIVRDNIIANNTQGGLVFGGYDRTVGTVANCSFTNNTLYHNDTGNNGNGEIWIQYASNCLIENNIIYSTSQDLIIDSQYNTNNTSKYNLFYTSDGADSAEFYWGGKDYLGLAIYEKATGQDKSSLFANPKLVNASQEDFQLQSGSPAVNTGDPAYKPAAGEVDYYRNSRLIGKAVDIGAIEWS